MSGPVITDETCGVFRSGPVAAALKPRTIHRFIVGRDDRVVLLSREEAAKQLGDPFATLLLLKGKFPDTAAEVLDELRKATGPNHRLGKRLFFMLGEGLQVPAKASVRRNLRFLVTTGTSQKGPDVMLSTFHPDSQDVEVMAWDRKRGGFNYYRTAEGSNGWVFAGNSLAGIERDTEFKGPFESHTSGNFLMKELKIPWLHWHSFSFPNTEARILPAGLRDHPWFDKKSGAEDCELQVAIPAITRWTERRFELIVGRSGAIDRPRRIMRQVLDSQTVNLISSETEATALDQTDRFLLPSTFFVDADALARFGLPLPDGFTIKSAMYAKTLKKFNVRWTDGGAFSRPGDTHFCFFVPERAFEDQETVRLAIESGLLGDRVAASLLMVDFANPVFSPRRTALLEHAPTKATLKSGKSTYGREFVRAILQAAKGTPANSPENEFAKRWEAGTGWKKEFSRLLERYYKGVEATLGTQAGVDAVFRVAETNRNRVRGLPIFEHPLLFTEAKNAAARVPARMRTDGTVAEAS